MYARTHTYIYIILCNACVSTGAPVTPAQNLYNLSIYLPTVLVRIYLLSILSILCILHYPIYSTYSIQSILSLPIACDILSYECFIILPSHMLSYGLPLSQLISSYVSHCIVLSFNIHHQQMYLVGKAQTCFSSCPKEQCHWTVIPQRSAGGLARAGAAEVRAVEIFHFGAIISQGVQGSRPKWTTDVFVTPKVDPIGARPQQK